jgi:2-oxoisovalerate dehydrogenase E2 component (dihydrolipoyl transacylase)
LSASATRRTIAANLKRSNIEAPQAWTMVEADVTPLVGLRNREKDRFQRQEGIDLTLLPYFTAAVCEALREYPMLNARWEGDELRRYRDLNLAIAVATETGLVTPVVHNAGDLSVTGLAKKIADLAQRAHSRKLRIEDIEGGTFTVNNTGSFGSIASKPIVNYPQVAIVTMERVVKRPVVMDNDAIAVRSMVNLCLSFDHRAMDGFEAGGFLASLKKHLEGMARPPTPPLRGEEPSCLLLELPRGWTCSTILAREVTSHRDLRHQPWVQARRGLPIQSRTKRPCSSNSSRMSRPISSQSPQTAFSATLMCPA